MQRSANFIVFPGTGMWMATGKHLQPTTMQLFTSLSHNTIKSFVQDPNWQLYWIDLGMGAANLLRVRMGGKSSSATLVTPALLKRYLKE